MAWVDRQLVLGRIEARVVSPPGSTFIPGSRGVYKVSTVKPIAACQVNIRFAVLDRACPAAAVHPTLTHLMIVVILSSFGRSSSILLLQEPFLRNLFGRRWFQFTVYLC